MNLRALGLFKEIHRSGSITAGAAALGMSQPSASRMLRHLETQLGYPLFERTDGRIRPTQEAEILIREVDQIFARVDQAASVARSLSRGEGERLSVVCVNMLAPIVLPRVMGRLHRHFPELALELDTKGQAGQLQALSARAADIGIATGPEPPPNVETHLFGRSRLMAVMPSNHPLSTRETVRLEDYARHPCILGAERDPLGGLAQDLFARHGVRPDVRLRIGSPLFCYEAVRTFGHLAVAGPMTTMAMAGRPGIQIRPLEPATDFAIYAMWRLDAAPNAARKVLLRLLAEEMRPLLDQPSGEAEGAPVRPSPRSSRTRRAPGSAP